MFRRLNFCSDYEKQSSSEWHELYNPLTWNIDKSSKKFANKLILGMKLHHWELFPLCVVCDPLTTATHKNIFGHWASNGREARDGP